ncbi:ROK family protein [Brachybacterium kimchii]|uniref:ROK family protein n=1 Tax=Brachybacterium kimchii TaxID=2942909 RepID=A0ABY4N2Y6_9MICO|nr:ROK family protein [Brachybacterium kimchii]UQN28919.1 ROK family protein [Brachybacterium kimchii]
MQTTAQRAEPRSVRRWNEKTVIDVLRAHGAQRISALRSFTGLTPGPLGDVLRGLSAKGWVVSVPDETPGRGRPAQRFRLSRPEGWVLGVDVGPHAVRAVRMDLAGNAVERVECEVLRPGDLQAMHERTAEAVGRCLQGIGAEDLWAGTLAVGGHLDDEGSVVRSVAVPAWEGHRPLELLSDVLPQPFSLINDVRAETLAEHEVGEAQDVEDFALAHLGRRPTLGIFLEGRIRRGAHGTAGDLSLHPQLGRGVTGATGDGDDADQLVAMIRQALAGDEGARSGIREALERMAEPFALAASVLDLAVIVIGGPFAAVPDIAVPALARAFDERSRSVPELRTTGLDQFAAATGAARQALGWVDGTLASAATGALERERSCFRAEVGGRVLVH